MDSQQQLQSSVFGHRIDGQAFSAGERAVCQALAMGSRILHLEEHDDLNQGQLSARSPSDPGAFLIKQVLAGFDEATPDEIVRAAYAPGSPQHKLAPPEVPLHQGIYAARSDVRAIVHTHALHTLAFGALQWEMEPISHEGACFQGRIAYFEETSHTILSIDVGRKVAAALGDAAVLFIRNHGCVVVGRTVREAVMLAVILERACRLQLMVRSTQVPYFTSPVADIRPKQEFIFGPLSIRTFWEYYERKVKRRFPEVAAWQ